MHYLKRLTKLGGSKAFIIPKVWLDACENAKLSSDTVLVSVQDAIIVISPAPREATPK